MYVPKDGTEQTSGIKQAILRGNATGCVRNSLSLSVPKAQKKGCAEIPHNPSLKKYKNNLNWSLTHHRMGHFHEAGDVGTFDIVDIVAFAAVLDALLVDAAHDVV